MEWLKLNFHEKEEIEQCKKEYSAYAGGHASKNGAPSEFIHRLGL